MQLFISSLIEKFFKRRIYTDKRIFVVSDTREMCRHLKAYRQKDGKKDRAPFVRFEAIKYACPNPNCKSVFNDKSNRNRHVNYQCGKPPRFQCSHCFYKSHHKAHVKTHAKSKHPDVNSHVIELYNPCNRRKKLSFF